VVATLPIAAEHLPCCNGFPPPRFHPTIGAEGLRMPTYQYRCGTCGRFELQRPMAEVAASASCPDCGEAARRVFGLPGVAFLDPGVRNAIDASARSAESPQVVTDVPGRARRATPITTDPRHAKLPRP
jgi:putative FmdB family regulatory protein